MQHMFQPSQSKELLILGFIIPWSKQGIRIVNRNGNFCKWAWVGKIIAETKVDARVEQ